MTKILLMTDDLQELDGVGPAREEDLNELGYEEYSELADADEEELAEDVPRLSEDKALSLVVQAQNAADLEDAEVETDGDDESASDDADDVSDEEEAEDSDDEETAESKTEDDSDKTDATDDDESPSASENGSETYSVSISLGTDEEYDSFYNAVYEQRNTLIRTNRDTSAETYNRILDNLRTISPGDSLEVELESEELNNLHNTIRQQATAYQGENLIEQMEALNTVERTINTEREEFLFD